MYNNLKMLCELNGVAGREHIVRDKIIEIIKPLCDEYKIDNLGNLICFKKGKQTPKNRVMLSAHMDEVGMMITHINSDGTILFDCVGGINPRVILGRAVQIGDKGLQGVIGAKPVHLLNGDERAKAVPIDKMCIDIGAKNKEDAMEHINLGDSVYFIGDYLEFGDGFVAAKAIDDRFGCLTLIEIMKIDLEYDTYFVFGTQEEVGLRGATAAAYNVNPDVAIVIEATTACDLSGVPDAKQVCKLGYGPVVSYRDTATIYDRELFNLAFETAKQNDIKCQTKTVIAGGNDSGAIHVSRGGVRTMAISVPCRYLHSESNVVKKCDLEDVVKLAKIMTEKVANV